MKTNLPTLIASVVITKSHVCWYEHNVDSTYGNVLRIRRFVDKNGEVYEAKHWR